jgi:hypothetical protein
MAVIPFEGFAPPTENWSKLPHAFIEAMDKIDSLGEMKVILYILRHTWGFQEFDTHKRITLDEFENGRKCKPSEKYPTGRMDGGCGATRPTIVRGLEKAEEHGFIEIERDDSDGARQKKWYKIKGVDNQGLNIFTPEVKDRYPGGKDSLPRSEKDTLETNFSQTDPGDISTLPLVEPDGDDSPRKTLLDAYNEANDVIVTLSLGSDNMQRIDALLDAGITPEQVTAFVAERKQEAFWRDKVVSLKYIAENIGTWRKASTGFVHRDHMDTNAALDRLQWEDAS